MSEVRLVPLMIVASGLMLVAARQLGVPHPLLLIVSGVLVGLVPGLPRLDLEPTVVFEGFLPPLLYASTVTASPHLLRATLFSAVLPGAVSIVVTMTVVALVARWSLPELPWSGAFLLGVVAAAADTRGVFNAAKQKLRIPRDLADRLRAESLITPIVLLPCFFVAREAALTGAFSAPSVAGSVVVDNGGGALLGLLVGWAAAWLRRRIDPTPVELAISLSTPYAASLLAGVLGVSRITAVIVAGFIVTTQYMHQRGQLPPASSRTRLQAEAFWDVANFLLSGILFFLVGLALPAALAELRLWSVWSLGLYGLAILGVVLALRFIIALVATLATRWDTGNDHAASRPLPVAAVVAWAGTRSVIAIVAALAIPQLTESGEPFPARDLVIVLTGVLAFFSLGLQGLTLTPLIRRLGLGDDDQEEREEAAARAAAAQAGLEVVRRRPRVNGLDGELAGQLAAYYERRARPPSGDAADGNGRGSGTGREQANPEDGADTFADLRRATLNAERQALLERRARNALGDEAFRRLQHELNVELERVELQPGAPP